jgi:chromosome segregation ATPase
VDELRDRLEQALLRRAARLLDVMADERGDDLAEVLRELDGMRAPEDGGPPGAEEADELRRRLAEREAELDRLRASVGGLRHELDAARAQAQEAERRLTAETAAGHEHERRARELQQRLAEATLRRSSGDTLVEGQRARLEQREARLADLERAAEERLAELDDLERSGIGRESRLDLREDELERLEGELTVREERLVRREAELAVYVGQVQEQLLQRRAS